MWPRWFETGAPAPWRQAPSDALAALGPVLQRWSKALANVRDLDPPLDASAMDDLWRAGLFTLTVPATLGGAELGMRDFCLAMFGVGRLGPAYAMTAVPHLCISVGAVATLAIEPWRSAVLRGIAEHRQLLVFAISEDRGSDLAAMHTRLAHSADGALSLHGSKHWITNLDSARYAVVAARCPSDHPVPGAVSLVLVDLLAPGVTVRADAWPKRCVNGSATGDVHFDGVALARSQLLGPIGQGMVRFHQLVLPGRLGAAAALLGMAQAALDGCAAQLPTATLDEHTAALDLDLAAVTSCAALGEAGDADFAGLCAVVKHGAGLAAQRVIEALALDLNQRGKLAPPSLARARHAAGLLRLLKGPGEVIALQAVAQWLGRAARPAVLPSLDSARLRWAMTWLARQLALLGSMGGVTQQPVLAAHAIEACVAVHWLWTAQQLGCDGARSRPPQQMRLARQLAWRQLRAVRCNTHHASTPDADVLAAQLKSLLQPGAGTDACFTQLETS